MSASPTCDAPEPAAQAIPEAIFEHGYYCDSLNGTKPKPRAGVKIVITEASGNIGMTVTSINVRLFSVGVGGAQGPLEKEYSLHPVEIAFSPGWGASNHISAGDMRIIKWQSHFPSGAHPEDGTAQATVYITDDNGNMTSLYSSTLDQIDKCDSM